MKEAHESSEKPYARCLSCPRFRKICGGIPTRGLDLKTWCEYMRDVKELAHLKNAQIAEKAEVSEKTIEKVMAINIEHDIMRSTARRIELAVIGPVGKNTCDIVRDDSEQITKLLAEIEYWKKENDRKAKIIDKYLDS